MSAVKLLIAGDRSTVGKSTVSLGILASLLDAGVNASEIAYIKPATQCVSATLAAKFCETVGIQYLHIGPVVFYRGFTREFLDGKHGSSQDLVWKCSNAVEKISQHKSIVLIDGVGYPTVGSIVGCSSVDIAKAIGAKVLIVGKPGVGDAVDSYNLCAGAFEHCGVDVLGAIFNKLPTKGSYNREKCEEYVTKYFKQFRPHQTVFGLIPVQEDLVLLDAEATCGLNFQHPDPEGNGIQVEKLCSKDQDFVDTIKKVFVKFVRLDKLILRLNLFSDEPPTKKSRE